jgi:hypothetical protein
MLIEFDDGWELHIRIQIHSMGTKKQPRYSIRHTHAHTLTYMQEDWFCKDIPYLFNLNPNRIDRCRVCDCSLPIEVLGAMKMITWSMKDAD